jgi:NAD-dependent dihydropyrimidine dehydrogenase PreA subunit
MPWPFCLRATLAQQRTEIAMSYIIADPCIGTKDGSCVSVCPVDCIYEGEEQYFIHPDECIDCGACEPECPVTAIYTDDALPAGWQSAVARRLAHFSAGAP